jgi:hypothetical protein
MSLIEEKRIELKDKFSWVNWSEIAREEIVKRIIFENYLKTKTLTDKEWAFCEKIDWHPVDELPIKEEFKKELEKRKKEKSVSIKSISDIFK